MTAWKQLLLLCGVTALRVSVALAVDQACYGTGNALQCSQHHLRCDEGTIFIIWALRGFTGGSSGCDAEIENCSSKDLCCRYIGWDCLKYYTHEGFSSLMKECWNKTSCTYTVLEASRGGCGSFYKDTSGYSMVEYLCLPGSFFLDFKDSSPRAGERVALRYAKSNDTNNYVCRVEAEDCKNHTVNVTMMKAPNKQFAYFGSCTTVGVDKKNWLNCYANSVSFASYTLQTPFDVNLYVVKNNDVDEVWIYIQASRSVRVTCKQWTENYSFPHCSSATATSTSGTTLFHTTSTTGHSTESPDMSTTDDVQSLSTTTAIAGSSPEVTEGTMPHSAENTGNTSAVVGGVVGAILVVGLVVVVVAILLFLKRRSPTGKILSVAWFKGDNSSSRKSSVPTNPQPERAEPHVAPAQPTSLPVYDNSMAAITDEAGVRVDPDSDYNHLGQKPTSSASRDVTYGHLAVGNDVTDYGYDHVAKGKPAVRSGDVINNVYNTAGPATGGSSGEDFYNTTVAAKNRPDVINNIYNTPSPATEASPDVDYYNTAGVPQTGPDVINSDYDIPKSARTPGPGETEAHDVTGDDAGCPYELARNVK